MNVVPLFHWLLARQAASVPFLSRHFALEEDKGKNGGKGGALKSTDKMRVKSCAIAFANAISRPRLLP